MHPNSRPRRAGLGFEIPAIRRGKASPSPSSINCSYQASLTLGQSSPPSVHAPLPVTLKRSYLSRDPEWLPRPPQCGVVIAHPAISPACAWTGNTGNAHSVVAIFALLISSRSIINAPRGRTNPSMLFTEKHIIEIYPFFLARSTSRLFSIRLANCAMECTVT
ncbi:hypothetical protein BDW69DRAFT_99651 [Aspergillus filifer]